VILTFHEIELEFEDELSHLPPKKKPPIKIMLQPRTLEFERRILGLYGFPSLSPPNSVFSLAQVHHL